MLGTAGFGIALLWRSAVYFDFLKWAKAMGETARRTVNLHHGRSQEERHYGGFPFQLRRRDGRRLPPSEDEGQQKKLSDLQDEVAELKQGRPPKDTDAELSSDDGAARPPSPAGRTMNTADRMMQRIQ